MIVYGRNTVRQALMAEWGLKEIRVAAGSEKTLKDIVRLAGQRGVPVRSVHKRDLAKWADTDAHQGVAAFAEQPREILIESLLDNAGKPGSGPLLLLDGVEDPRNFGAILRSALAAGVAGVIVPKHRSAPLSGAALKASAGAAFEVPIARVTNLSRTIEALKERGYWIYAADPKSGKVIYDVDWAPKSAIVLGGEGKGIRSLVGDKCDVFFRIPLNPRVQSLNVSVASGIILFEYRRWAIKHK